MREANWQKVINLLMKMSAQIEGTRVSVMEAASILGFCVLEEKSTSLSKTYLHEFTKSIEFFHMYGVETFGAFLNRRWIDHEKQKDELHRIRGYYADRFRKVEAYLTRILGKTPDSIDGSSETIAASRWTLGEYDLKLEFSDLEEYDALFLTLGLEPNSLKYLYEGRQEE